MSETIPIDLQLLLLFLIAALKWFRYKTGRIPYQAE